MAAQTRNGPGSRVERLLAIICAAVVVAWAIQRLVPCGRVGFARVAMTGQGRGRTSTRCSGRGERDSPATTDLVVVRLAEPPEPFELVRST